MAVAVGEVTIRAVTRLNIEYSSFIFLLSTIPLVLITVTYQVPVREGNPPPGLTGRPYNRIDSRKARIVASRECK
jgi:hypothetical protein